MTTTIFNKCNCLNFTNQDINDLNGYKQKAIIGSFLPLCQDCLKKDSIKIKYILKQPISDKYQISSTEISELISTLKFLIKEKQKNIMIQNKLQNDTLLKWLDMITCKESKNELIKSMAKKIDNGLADIWSSAYESKKLPCNIKLVIFNSTIKKELYSSYWSYQYCEFYFDTKVF